jgi:hypothetical protein
MIRPSFRQLLCKIRNIWSVLHALMIHLELDSQAVHGPYVSVAV